MKKIAAIVVTYDRKLLLKECVKALLQYGEPADIFVIDNGAESRGVQNERQRIRYYSTGKNLGGAGGFGYGIRKAYQLGYEYFWLMDDDTIINKDTLPELLCAVQALDPGWGYLSSLSLWKDGTPCRMNHHRIAKNWEQYKGYLPNGIMKIHTATFVSFFIRKEVIEKVGLPIREYFIWGDDTEYSCRIAETYPCFLAGRSTVLHKMKDNKTANLLYMEDTARIDRAFYSVRNDMCTNRRRGVGVFIKFMAEQAYHFLWILFCCKEYKRRKLKVLVKGFCAGLIFSPKIEKLEPPCGEV